MDIRQLRYFVEICRYKNFTRAAEACYISPQGISLSIQRLEEELGKKLFRRSTKEVGLTEDAEYLLPRAKQVIDIIDDCDAHFKQGENHEETIKVPFVMGSIEEFTGDVIRQFSDKYIKLDAMERFDFACEKSVMGGDSELAVTVGPVDDDVFDQTWLYSTKNVLIVHKDNPLASMGPISVRDLRDVPIVALNPRMRSFQSLTNACRQEGFEPTISNFVDSVMLIFYMAEMNQAVGLTTLTLCKRMRRPDVVPVLFKDPLFDREVFVIKKKSADLTHYAGLLEKMLIARRDAISG
ncbi:MAG: LysR family transcriptional regulator [Clostridiales Family XIII bacterium]|nr:LysR family transcriptional regulator [Clostridiales Family XIII bacterium]